MKILVTGGLGFVGSVTARMLADHGHEVIVFDNRFDPVDSARQALLLRSVNIVKGDIRNPDHLDTVLAEKPDVVCHLAALCRVAEGERSIADYIDVNVHGTARLLEAMNKAGVKKLLHASTSAIYGTVDGKVNEGAPSRPESWYGKTKLWAEEVVQRFVRGGRLCGYIFRFGNVAGAGYGVYENRPGDDRIIVKAVRAGLSGDVLPVHGKDWPTPDGTCVRDYIHVLDIATAFLKAIDVPSGMPSAEVINLGCARPVSVKEVIQTVSQMTGLAIRSAEHDRRPGDAASVWLSNERAFLALRWEPVRGLTSMVEDYWKAYKEAVTT